ncbi:MAG: AzlD domain-containing protein [Longicatena sp.]
MNNYIPYILIMAAVTYLIRMIPLTFFHKEIHNKFIQSFLFYVPYAVLGAMTFPAIFTSGGSVISSSIGCLAGLFFAYKEKGLLSVAMVTCVVVFIVDIVI